MKHPELKCTYHKGITCMGYGVLFVQQSLIPGTKEYEETTTVWGPEAGEGPHPFRMELGQFCTVSALMSWCQAEGAMHTPRNAMEAKRRPPPRNPDARPTVPQRRQRPSLMGGDRG